MQLPSVERSHDLRPAGADVVAPAAGRVIPVKPVNPAQTSASVVSEISPEARVKAAQVAEVDLAAAPDPLKGGSQADNTNKGWTQRKPAPGRPEEPPKEPISKMLIEHIHSLWAASARAVELLYMHNQAQSQNPNQVQNLAANRNQDPSAIPGLLAKEVLTYSPSKIKKPENL